MNNEEKWLFSLCEEYSPYLKKYSNLISPPPNAYWEEGNIRLLFGYFGDPYMSLYISGTPTPSKFIGEPIKFKDYDYSRHSIEYYNDFEHEWDYSDESENFNIFTINSLINDGKKDNFSFICLNPFNDEALNESYDKLQKFIQEQIEICNPDAVIIGINNSTSNYFLDEQSKDRLKMIFGNDIVFFPFPYPADFVKKYKDDEHNEIALVEGGNLPKSKIYVYTWDCYHEKEYVIDFLKVVSNTIKKNILKK